jgi:hypothetical protein
MVAKTARYWRMAFREGSQGVDHWEDCYRLGVAVIAMAITDDDKPLPDLTRVPKEKFNEFMVKHAGAPQTSLDWSFRKFRYDLKPGDIIYAKSGARLVGKGLITGNYSYKVDLLRKKGHEFWAHYRKVEWEKGVEAISKDKIPAVFEAPLHTILELKGSRLSQLLEFERKRFGKGQRGDVTKAAPTQDINEVEEGERAIREVRFQVRNRGIIEEKKRRSDGTCDVCGFRTANVYLDLSRDILVGHHMRPLSDTGRSRKTALKDIAIVCPNCHQAMHTENPPLTVDKLKAKLDVPF